MSVQATRTITVTVGVTFDQESDIQEDNTYWKNNLGAAKMMLVDTLSNTLFDTLKVSTTRD